MNFVMEDPTINGKVLEENRFFEDKDCLVELLDTINDNGVREQGNLFVNRNQLYLKAILPLFNYQDKYNLFI